MAGKRPSLLAALALAPLAASAVIALLVWITVGFGSWAGGEGLHAQILVGVFSFLASFSLVFSLTFGVLVHGELQKRGRRGWISYTIAGLIAALAVMIVLIAYAATKGGVWPVLLFALPFALPTGALTGVFFWLIRRPDRDAPGESL
ncbi:MAG TPA: hypothetical protein VM915_12230 [Verrucomicrobiae bacterium]|jgi:hypothetical protein|nr:hypothetical protein [Verrucomicrobiae bacterium]